jgi:hypothetical protein
MRASRHSSTSLNSDASRIGLMWSVMTFATADSGSSSSSVPRTAMMYLHDAAVSRVTSECDECGVRAWRV